ncbi:biotin-independent malonate decarboxylase subunit gamma [Neopusillimonas aromaticivorans]|uniref:biotin-independent malonate decarboxylase subunit gamma n=1 Tax=Neopusillimonas aromaticivorans TaxID=2979868 RepID=UPI0025937CEF|nr:biotin-independent malonate decarboxylase subunit gamma [Neopusillimonas aromaticivorans]WJJ92560.1 biotin-independent malonate decarboxylase subunit gamma [Neopusillimonas aromaticivorans]
MRSDASTEIADLPKSRGDTWLHALAADQPIKSPPCAAIRYADATLNNHACRLIAVVPDPHSPFPRARHGEVGLAEGWGLAQLIHDTIDADRNQPHQRTLIALVDVPSQAYGRLEETQGLHQALAAAVSAWIHARIAGHRVIGLIVGQAISGAYLAHGYQAHRLIALDDPGVQLHAMGKASAARVTQRSVEALDELAKTVPPWAMALSTTKRSGCSGTRCM